VVEDIPGAGEDDEIRSPELDAPVDAHGEVPVIFEMSAHDVVDFDPRASVFDGQFLVDGREGPVAAPDPAYIEFPVLIGFVSAGYADDEAVVEHPVAPDAHQVTIAGPVICEVDQPVEILGQFFLDCQFQ